MRGYSIADTGLCTCLWTSQGSCQWFLQPAWVPVSSSPALQHYQLLPPVCCSSTNLLRVHSDPSHRWWIKTLSSTDPDTVPWKIPLLAGCQLDCAPLIDSFIPAVQPAFQPHYLSLIQFLSHWLNDKVTTGHGAGVPDEIKVYSIHHLSLVHSTGHLVTASNEAGYNDLPFINLRWLFPITLFAFHVFRNYFGKYLLCNWSHGLRLDWFGTSFRPQDIRFPSFGHLPFAWDKHGSL